MKVLTAAQMAALDRRAIESIRIPGPVLMENAAAGAVCALGECFPQAENVLILAGPGNNGGDGLAMARHLDGRGYRCRVFQAVNAAGRLSTDAEQQRGILERAGMAVETVGPEDDLSALLDAFRDSDLVVDALFGTGLARALAGHFATIVQAAGTSGVPVLAVDLPSGLDGSRATPIGPYLEAEVTVTFAMPKVAHVLPPAADAVGQLVVVDLGIPAVLLDEAESDLELLDGGELAPLVAHRPRAGHKGSYGHVLLVAGGPGGAGAAVLAARAAVRGGAGLVTVATPAAHAATVDLGSLESMTIAFDTDADGGLDAGAVDVLRGACEGKSVLAIGPGLGGFGTTPETVRALAAEIELPLVLDADGLNAFARRIADLAARPAPTVLTPHPGEMARLLGMTTRQVEDDRLAAVRRAAEASGAVVVLKGRCSLIAAPGKPVAVNPTGNAGMATGGSGDVLTGLVAALLAQGLDSYDAACVAVYLHGLAGDLAAAESDECALAAGDLLNHLGAAFGRLRARM